MLRRPRRVFLVIPAAAALAFLAACSSSGSGHGLASSDGSPSGGPTSTPGASSPATSASATPSASKTSPSPTVPSRTAGAEAGLGGCAVAPADSVWRARVDHLPVAANSSAIVASIGTGKHMHADFGSGTWDGGPIGIPVTVAPRGTAKVRVTFDYADESDKGPYPIPANALVEGGPQADGDRHVLVLDPATCTDYELYDAHRNSDGSWKAGSGAVFHLGSDKLRPSGWTSADAAGLPILPGLARYDEAATGTIDHALRITVPASRTPSSGPRGTPPATAPRTCRRWDCACA